MTAQDQGDSEAIVSLGDGVDQTTPVGLRSPL